MGLAHPYIFFLSYPLQTLNFMIDIFVNLAVSLVHHDVNAPKGTFSGYVIFSERISRDKSTSRKERV